MNPAFNTITVTSFYLPVFNKQSLRLIEKLKNEIGMGKTFDIGPYIFREAFASIYGKYLSYVDYGVHFCMDRMILNM